MKGYDMGWKASHPHESTGKTAKIGSTHIDVYRTNAAGKRSESHHKDVKISGSSHSRSMRDIHHSSRSRRK